MRDRLTNRRVTTAKVPGMLCDGRGLNLEISKAGTKSWIFRYNINGRTREMGLGSLADVSLAEAREERDRWRKLLRQGTDPIEARKIERMQVRIANTKAMTFDECARAYVSAHSTGWRSVKQIGFLRPGDELVVVKLDRLGRSTRDVLNLVHELEKRGAGLRVLEPEFSTSNDAGRMLVTVFGMVAELERRFILERQAAGIAKAKLNGIYRGRKPSINRAEIQRLKAEGLGASAIAKQLGIGRASVYRLSCLDN
jgi:Resolvase, N terminal domain/Arm DNA-binding domain/Helix-turn-helix domain of resolvase